MWSGWPAIVVEDGPKIFVTYIPAGTTVRYAVDADGRELRVYSSSPWGFADRPTTRPVLSVTTPGSEHATLLFWSDAWAFESGELGLLEKLAGYQTDLLRDVVREAAMAASNPEPLGTGRRQLAWLTLIIFLLCFTPAPLRENPGF